MKNIKIHQVGVANQSNTERVQKLNFVYKDRFSQEFGAFRRL